MRKPKAATIRHQNGKPIKPRASGYQLSLQTDSMRVYVDLIEVIKETKKVVMNRNLTDAIPKEEHRFAGTVVVAASPQLLPL